MFLAGCQQGGISPACPHPLIQGCPLLCAPACAAVCSGAFGNTAQGMRECACWSGQGAPRPAPPWALRPHGGIPTPLTPSSWHLPAAAERHLPGMGRCHTVPGGCPLSLSHGTDWCLGSKKLGPGCWSCAESGPAQSCFHPAFLRGGEETDLPPPQATAPSPAALCTKIAHSHQGPAPCCQLEQAPDVFQMCPSGPRVSRLPRMQGGMC